MKLQELLKRHKAISEYVRLAGGRVSATFTHQYLPLLYSSNSLDIVMQNIIMALLGNLLQHFGSLSVIKTISISVPLVKMVLSVPKLRMAPTVKQMIRKVKVSVSAMSYPADAFMAKAYKWGSKNIVPGTFRFGIPIEQFSRRNHHHAAAASA